MKKVEKEKQKDNFTKLTQKKGISLIVLIVTIIVIIILAAAVILTITKNNPVDSAKESAFKEDVRIFQDDLALTVAKEYTDKQGQRDQKISTSDYDKIKEYIPSFTEKYKDKFIIQDDQLVGTDSLSEKEKMWANDINISTSGKASDGSETDVNCFLWDEDGTTIIGLDEEKLSGVTKIKIPSKCKVIRSDFYSSSLTEDYRNLIKQMVTVEIPDTVTEIGEYAFYEWKNLENVTMSSNITSIGNSAFSGCNNLTNITIPESVTSIGNSAFSGCNNLTNIIIPESVTSIGNYAFASCSSLTSIAIPESVTSIGSCAFDDCSSLTNITILDGVTSIENQTFYNCRSLTSITIPDSVTSIGKGAFESCRSLTNINVSDNNKNYSSIDGVLFNKDKTEIIKYPEGKESKSYKIQEGVKSIEGSAFSYCRSLTNITILDGVTSIGNWAFCDCSSLTSITIPESVTSIGNYAFASCSSLTNIMYNGTQSQWNSISKGSYWKTYSAIKTVTCTDGVIQIN